MLMLTHKIFIKILQLKFFTDTRQVAVSSDARIATLYGPVNVVGGPNVSDYRTPGAKTRAKNPKASVIDSDQHISIAILR